MRHENQFFGPVAKPSPSPPVRNPCTIPHNFAHQPMKKTERTQKTGVIRNADPARRSTSRLCPRPARNRRRATRGDTMQHENQFFRPVAKPSSFPPARNPCTISHNFAHQPMKKTERTQNTGVNATRTQREDRHPDSVPAQPETSGERQKATQCNTKIHFSDLSPNRLLPPSPKSVVAVGMPVAQHPPHRSVRAEFPHTAPISDA